MKFIKTSEPVHQRLMEDKKHFTEVIGYRFTLSDTIREYQKIIDQYADNKPPLKNNPRLPLETPSTDKNVRL